MKIIVAMTLAGSLALAGCATTTTGTTDLASEIAQAQQIAVTACGFLPTAETVSGIISTFVAGASPVNAVASQVASAICTAVTAKSVKLSGSVATVRGVPIDGKFVTKSLKKGAAAPAVNGVLINGQFVR